MDRLARFRRRLNRLRASHQEKLANQWDELSSLLESLDHAQSITSPAPYAMLSQLAEQAELLREQLEEQTQLANGYRDERDQAIASHDLLRVEYQEQTEVYTRALAEITSLRDQIDFIQSELKSQSLKLHSDSLEAEGALVELENLRNDKHQLEEQVCFLSNELDVYRQVRTEESDDLLVDLRTQLLEARRDVVELRMQNSDLAEQLLRSKNNKTAQESLTWEERKKILLSQLELESGDTQQVTRSTMEDLIATTHREIERRDQEIEELKQIVSEQSSARDGLAVGAAAIAHLLDADELIQDERTKLRKTQAEWEEKARAAEIELSRERAKIARERLELENRFVELKKVTEAAESSKIVDPKNQRGNWLSRLGLKDEKAN